MNAHFNILTPFFSADESAKGGSRVCKQGGAIVACHRREGAMCQDERSSGENGGFGVIELFWCFGAVSWCCGVVGVGGREVPQNAHSEPNGNKG